MRALKETKRDYLLARSFGLAIGCFLATVLVAAQQPEPAMGQPSEPAGQAAMVAQEPAVVLTLVYSLEAALQEAVAVLVLVYSLLAGHPAEVLVFVQGLSPAEQVAPVVLTLVNSLLVEQDSFGELTFVNSLDPLEQEPAFWAEQLVPSVLTLVYSLEAEHEPVLVCVICFEAQLEGVISFVAEVWVVSFAQQPSPA